MILPLCGRPGGGGGTGFTGWPAALYLPGTPGRGVFASHAGCLARARPEESCLQGNLESILQTPGGSPQRLVRGAALRAFSLYC